MEGPDAPGLPCRRSSRSAALAAGGSPDARGLQLPTVELNGPGAPPKWLQPHPRLVVLGRWRSAWGREGRAVWTAPLRAYPREARMIAARPAAAVVGRSRAPPCCGHDTARILADTYRFRESRPPWAYSRASCSPRPAVFFTPGSGDAAASSLVLTRAEALSRWKSSCWCWRSRGRGCARRRDARLPVPRRCTRAWIAITGQRLPGWRSCAAGPVGGRHGATAHRLPGAAWCSRMLAAAAGTGSPCPFRWPRSWSACSSVTPHFAGFE